ncbi:MULTISPECIES: TIGR02647 family protein [Aliagarivorans]|uniref:TIGR02647 family protein n=1 Tax=Aliagarivorans TaxID=882379 RepID=UPI000417F219|nr:MULTISPECIES: TIGR02647 family protein [Aliagarivorans]
MPFSKDVLNELNLLLKFDASSQQTGIKVSSDAAPEMVAAAKGLFDKGLCTRDDGGYLTDLGNEVLNHLAHIDSVMAPVTS